MLGKFCSQATPKTAAFISGLTLGQAGVEVLSAVFLPERWSLLWLTSALALITALIGWAVLRFFRPLLGIFLISFLAGGISHLPFLFSAAQLASSKVDLKRPCWLRVLESPRRPRHGLQVFDAAVDCGLGSVFSLRVKDADVPWTKTSNLRQGDLLLAEVTAEFLDLGLGAASNPFSYQAFLLRRGLLGTAKIKRVHGVVSRSGSEGGLEIFLKNLSQEFKPGPALGVSVASTVGTGDMLDESTVELFRRTGLSHLLVVSGYQVGLLYFFFNRLFALLLVYNRALLIRGYVPYLSNSASFVVVLCYAYLIGFQASVLRAVLALVLLLSGRLWAKRAESWLGFCLVFTCSNLLAPGSIFEPGSQLTFAAVAGLLLASDYREILILRSPTEKLKTRVLGFLLLTLFPSLCTAPVLVLWFSQVCPGAVLFNLLFAALFSCYFTLICGLCLLLFYLEPGWGATLLTHALSLGEWFLKLLGAIEEQLSRHLPALLSFELSPEGISSLLVFLLPLSLIYLKPRLLRGLDYHIHLRH